MAGVGAIGIDLGSENSTIAVVKNNTVEVLQNQGFLIPSIVSFQKNKRLMGFKSQLQENPQNSIIYPTRLLGLSATYSYLSEETKWLTNTLTNHMEHKVTFCRQEKLFRPEQVVGMVLSGLSETTREHGLSMSSSDLVLSVPVYLREVERRAYMDASKIAEADCLQTMHDTTAAALGYGILSQGEFIKAPKVVAFADLGASKFTVSIVEFKGDQLKVLAHSYDRNLGGRDFNWEIMNYLSQEFYKEFGIEPLTTPSSKLKLQLASEKLKRDLSTHSEAVASIENLTDNFDLNAKLSRTKFTELCYNLYLRLEETCVRALKIAGKLQKHSLLV